MNFQEASRLMYELDMNSTRMLEDGYTSYLCTVAIDADDWMVISLEVDSTGEYSDPIMFESWNDFRPYSWEEHYGEGENND